ncbi:hypothetical protein [Allochromatium vinosum]|uniref:Uncharacterized protein n=1 Tax=Allochromatium vinosum (strain ATCC 17899 / DSM 180 / NBRC 103801 / NCIMB 10441 / D) TaxID=572477 RepID=D3RU14_ALLVD|nr:hypothetical protein [Allochromatium vinosum]ADC62673.1 hypothetical protein Alvin_1743 [Allochromatium vinosum DSM 180]MBK1653328.1 hypothetical protein [Allochromatium vinosum]
MFKFDVIRIATIAALGALSVQWGTVRADQSPPTGVAAKLEVKVLEAPQQTGYEALYRMEVISVLQSSIRVKPGDIIRVRSRLAGPDTPDQSLKPRGWIGTAYLNPDPRAIGPEARFQFVGAANGDSFAELPPTPPSVRWIEYPREGTE